VGAAESSNETFEKRDESNHNGSVHSQGNRASRRKLVSIQSNVSSKDSGAESATSENGKRRKTISYTQACSVSDLTDSNKGSLANSGNHESSTAVNVEIEVSKELQECDAEKAAASASSISSNAAVASVRDGKPHHHSDLVIKGRKRSSREISGSKVAAAIPQAEEATSLDPLFQLDYQEVFLKSNVPQVLASTHGLVVAWNDLFLRMSGFSAEDMQRMTIFSLVDSSRLSDVFAIFAKSLGARESRDAGVSKVSNPCEADDPSSSNDAKNKTDGSDPSRVEPCEASASAEQAHGAIAATGCDSSDNSSGEALKTPPPQLSDRKNYEAVTLPCIRFQPMIQQALATGKEERNPPFVTLTLMPHDDPRKRCFHGLFLDIPGPKGELGSVSPEILRLSS
jgi:hypothetical protein